jgi:AmmeMemoRadiSam system protein B
MLDEVWGGDETLVVVSSDLSHFLSYDRACERDRATAQTILALSPCLVGEDACGAAPANGLLAVAQRRGLDVELADLRNSGDTCGDRRRVVGYGAFAFREPQRRNRETENPRARAS